MKDSTKIQLIILTSLILIFLPFFIDILLVIALNNYYESFIILCTFFIITFLISLCIDLVIQTVIKIILHKKQEDELHYILNITVSTLSIIIALCLLDTLIFSVNLSKVTILSISLCHTITNYVLDKVNQLGDQFNE